MGGDVYTGPKFCIDAIAAGREAAESIHRFVHEGQDLRLGRPLPLKGKLDTGNVDWDCFDRAPRQRPAAKAGSAVGTMSDLRGEFTEDQLKKETARCLGCGATVVDANMCLGCGVCTTKCRFDAISLVRVHDAAGAGYDKIIPGKMLAGMGKRAVGITVKAVTAPFRKG